MEKYIRPIALAVVQHNGRLLVFEGYDKQKEQIFYRPLGGGIEYGEHSREAVVREMQEELNAEIINLRFMNAVENIFIYNGSTSHEIVFLYEADFADKSLYEQEIIHGVELDGGEILAIWVSIADCKSGQVRLYPPGLAELL